jgi:hypothetical protein
MSITHLTGRQSQEFFEEEVRRNPAGLTLIGGSIVLGVETFGGWPAKTGDLVGLHLPEGTDVQRGDIIVSPGSFGFTCKEI